MDSLIQDTTIENDQIKEITTGNFIKDGYKTYKITIRAPDSAKVDVDQYSLYLLIGKKNKVFPIVKEAPQTYIKDFQQNLESILKANGPNQLLKQCQTEFDQTLLKQFQYFRRYQATDQEGCTILRYLFKLEAEVE